jgi:hypothetical protein
MTSKTIFGIQKQIQPPPHKGYEKGGTGHKNNRWLAGKKSQKKNKKYSRK